MDDLDEARGRRPERGRLGRTLVFLAAAAAFGLFYYRYVPLIPELQIVLAPALAAVLVVTASSVGRGVFAFAALLPLVGGLPYFFGVDLALPHAPATLLLGAAFFLGWLAGRVRTAAPLSLPAAVGRPAALGAALIAVSAAITVWRYTDFAPLLAPAPLEIQVNALGVRAGGAIMSIVFGGLNDLLGLFGLAVFASALAAGPRRKAIASVLTASTLAAVLFGFVQRLGPAGLGNTALWLAKNRINATFTDPNAFGAFVAALLPLAAGLAVFGGKRGRWLFFAASAAILAVFPFIGSRSSALALIGGLAVFAAVALPSLGRVPAAAARRAGLIAVAAGLAFGLVAFVAKGASLGDRIRDDVGLIRGKAGLEEVAGYRKGLWEAAVGMISRYPWTGVGAGAYIIELPNFYARMGIRSRLTDSALNTALQDGAEEGAPGLAARIWLWIAIALALRKAWRSKGPEAEGRLILAGAAAGLASLGVNFVFHTYVGNFEIIALFALLAALGVSASAGSPPRLPDDPGETGGKAEPPSGRAKRRWFAPAAAAFSLLYGATHAWHSWRGLSVPGQSLRQGWPRDFGLFPEEQDAAGRAFRWAGARAGIAVPVEGRAGGTLVVPLLAAHPDLGRKPVRVQFFRADEHFRKTGILAAVDVREPDWAEIEIPVPASETRALHLVVETSRVWTPREATGAADDRKLGVALGKVAFR